MTNRALLGLTLGTLCCVTAACSATTDEDDVNGGDSALNERAGAEHLPTTEPGISLHDGYATLFDLQRTRCVAGEGAPTVGQLQQVLALKQVQSETELANELGLDATLSVKVPTASGAASGSMVKSFKSSSSNVSYLLKSVQSYVVTNRGAVALTPEALGWLRNDRAEFLHRCGDRFVGSITFEARVYALITFATSSEDRALKLQAEISGGAAVGVAQVDASLKSKLTNASKRTGVQTSMEIVAQGFDTTQANSIGAISGTLEEKLQKIEEVGRSMGNSLTTDRQTDLADYAANRSRAAIPASVSLVRYGIASNTPPGAETAQIFDEHRETLKKTEAFLRAFGQLELGMERAYKEVDAFQKAGPNAQAGYNLAPPAAPKRFADDLTSVASAWASRFHAAEGVETGTDIQAVRDVVSRCVDSAKNGSYAACQLGEDPRSLAPWKAGRAALDEYKATGRIVRASFYVIENGGARTYSSALSTCKDNEGWVNRLPSAQEAVILAPVIAGWGGGQTKTIWIADMPTCKFSASGQSFYKNPIDGADAATGCAPWSVFDQGTNATICVGQRGPIGKLPEL